MKLIRINSATKGMPFVASLLSELSEEFGAAVHVDAEYGYVGYVDFASGHRAFFKNTSFDINPQAASAIVRDKDYCAAFLRHMGHPVPEGVLLYSPKYKQQMRAKNEAIAERLGFAEEATAFVDRHGLPLFLKPNDGSEGRNVTKVYSLDELFEALWRLFDDDDMIVLQKPVKGRDFRIVVLDGEVVSAYERLPFGVAGDGASSIDALMKAELTLLRSKSRGSKVRLDDPRIAAELKRQNLTLRSIPDKGARVALLPNANLSSGGTSVDLTDRIHDSFKAISAKVARDLNLTLAGIDLLAEDVSAQAGDYCILEVNSAPGLNNFAGSSAESDARTRALYRRVFMLMGKEATRAG